MITTRRDGSDAPAAHPVDAKPAAETAPLPTLTPTPTPTPLASTTRLRNAAIVATAAVFVTGWGGNQFTPLLVHYRHAHGWSATTVNALFAAYVLGLVPALLQAGRRSDRHGRRPLVLAALAASFVGGALIASGDLVGIACGRFVSGLAVGTVMAVGTTWVTELTIARGRPKAAGGRRASLWLTAGFAAGAGVAGLLAQWAPAAETTAYLPHLFLAAITGAAVAAFGVETSANTSANANANTSANANAAVHLAVQPEWRTTGGAAPTGPDATGPDATDLTLAGGRSRVVARHRRFRTVIAPAAPWVFGAAAVAYAILPQALAPVTGRWALLAATALTIVTLGCGVGVQPLAGRLDAPGRPDPRLLALLCCATGVLLAAAATATGSIVLAFVAAATLGISYGIGLVAGLVDTQRLATPNELATLTGAFYALTYLGFFLPVLLATFGAATAMPEALVGVAVCVAATAGLAVRGGARLRPARRGANEP